VGRSTGAYNEQDSGGVRVQELADKGADRGLRKNVEVKKPEQQVLCCIPKIHGVGTPTPPWKQATPSSFSVYIFGQESLRGCSQSIACRKLGHEKEIPQ